MNVVTINRRRLRLRQKLSSTFKRTRRRSDLFEWVNSQSLAKVNRARVKRLRGCGGEKVQLVSSRLALTGMAVPGILFEVDGKNHALRSRLMDRTRATQLMAVRFVGFPVKQSEHVSDGNPLANQGKVNLPFVMRSLVHFSFSKKKESPESTRMPKPDFPEEEAKWPLTNQ